jgi:arginine exporter protein ArgO|tara:strand:+ start:1381 stop:1668 length:288 start_codon:yes stop_codon:yes gene_type:complete
MNNFFDLLSNNPTYLIIAVVFSVIILFSVAKKLLKIALVAGSIFILWTAYTIWSGQELTQDELKNRIIETGEKLKENTVKKVQEKTQEQIKKQIN